VRGAGVRRGQTEGGMDGWSWEGWVQGRGAQTGMGPRQPRFYFMIFFYM
jgi:hypothetical protein